MKILAIVGSKRKNGNTSELIKQTLLPFKTEDNCKTEILFLGDYSIEGCRGCEGCATTNQCVIQDDMQDIYKKLRESDALIVGSPTYFYNITSDMKKFIERCYCFFTFDKDDRSVWISEFEQVNQKYVSTIAVCEQNNEKDMGFTSEALQLSFTSLGYRIVSNQKIIHAFKAGEVLSFRETMKTAKDNGKRLLKTLVLNTNSSC